MILYEVMDEPKDMVNYSVPVILFVIGPAEHAISCALACENIMLAAHSLGLGSCYVGFGSMIKGDADVVHALELRIVNEYTDLSCLAIQRMSLKRAPYGRRRKNP
jgi:hypothetical protein